MLQGDVGKAIELNEDAFAECRKSGDKHTEETVLGNLGNCYYMLGNYPQALDYYRRHEKAAREIGDKRGVANAIWNTSLTLVKTGLKKEARKMAEAALHLYRETESPTAVEVEKTLAIWRGESA